MARIKRIHVNGHIIKANKKEGRNDPVITVKDYQANRKGRRAVGYCPCCGEHAFELKQDFDSPMKSGAVTWIETKADVEVEA